ncbi:MAG: CHAT domain-containing protein [candidate division Zixibacteria bacterium]|nr:CHAT domain-containing protein [candidate division Zixibacteria bacterium]
MRYFVRPGYSHLLVGCILLVLLLNQGSTGTDHMAGGRFSEVAFSAAIDRAAKLLDSEHADSALSLAWILMDQVTGGIPISNVELVRLHLLIGNGYCLRGLFDSSQVYIRKTIDLAAGNRSADSLMADAYCTLGHVHAAQDRLPEAIDCFRQALEIRVDMPKPDSTIVADIMYWLGMHLAWSEHHEEAESMFMESLRIREMVLGPYHMDVARSLSALTGLCLNLYEHDHALAYGHRALSIVEHSPERSDNAVAGVLNQLATIYRSQGQYDQAEPLYLRAMTIWNDQTTPDRLNVANCLRNLGALYESQGRYGEAEQCYHKALDMRIAELGTDNGAVAGALNCLGNLCCKQGRWEDAEGYYNEVMAIWERHGESNSLGAAKCLVSMAAVYQVREDWDNAERYARRALAIREAKLPPNHPDIADALYRLSSIFTSRRSFAEAEPLIRKMASILRESLGPHHPFVATGLISIARLYRGQGRDAEAENCLKQALAIREEVLGPRHPNVFIVQHELACLYAETDRIEQSLDLHRRSQRARDAFVSDVFYSSSESQKLRWIKKMPLIDSEFLMLAFGENDQDLAQAAMEMVLQGKSAVNEAVMAENRAAFRSEDASVVSALNERVSVCTEISNLALTDGDGGSPESRRERMLALYRRKDSLDTQLSRTCRVFDELAVRQRASVGDVAASLPPEAVLWEYVRLNPGESGYTAGVHSDNESARYIGMVLTGKGDVHMVDLGDAELLDSLIQKYLDQVNEAISKINSSTLAIMEKLLSNTSGELYGKVFVPLAERCRGFDEIFVCPDGLLNLLPFEALSMEGGMYVIEKYRLSYLSSGRDLIRFDRERHERINRALVMADPDFGASITPAPVPTDDNPSMVAFLEPVRGAIDCLEDGFPRLRFTRTESEAVVQTIRNKGSIMVEEKYGPEAVESVLKELTEAPGIVHVATHGFACGDHVGSAALNNPLLRSGLVLAGANRRSEDKYVNPRSADDGFLTAFEASGLNLLGTELVSLSACKTGAGEVVSGEGVFGLRRAFQHAGARSILMSLWNVPDRQTSLLMEGFYTRWLGGMNKRDALREAALEIISGSRAGRGCAHPILWGGFILVGDPQ